MGADRGGNRCPRHHAATRAGACVSLVLDDFRFDLGQIRHLKSCGLRIVGAALGRQRVLTVIAWFGNDGNGNSNHSTSNGVDGIRCSAGCLLTSNSVVANGSTGIEGGAGGVIQGNSVRENGGIGISGTGGSAVGTQRPLALNNVLIRNGSVSITGCAIRENVMVGNFFPFIVSTFDLGNNVCNNGGLCQ